MTIGERIKQRRIELGLSADDVAKKLEKNRSTVFRYESSDIEKMPTAILEKLAVILHTSPAYLMGWEENNNSGINNGIIGNQNNNNTITVSPVPEPQGEYRSRARFPLPQNEHTAKKQALDICL